MVDDPHWRHAETQDSLQSVEQALARSRAPALTVLLHPDPRRVGAVARLSGLPAGRTVGVSRLEPDFVVPGETSGQPLIDPRISRRPFWIERVAGGLRLDGHDSGTRVILDGAPVAGEALVRTGALERGAVLQLGAHFVLLLHEVPGVPPRGRGLGLVGASEGIERLRGDIARVADLGVPVLIRGESGTGKELVARAIHDASPRASRPYVAVNMAAITASTAASELFGHVRGAFTGAARDHRGYFAQAEGGTLFLDEVGETPAELQAMLLRVLETGEIQPVGAARRQQSDVRVVAATDADLEGAVAAGRFKAPLLHRLAGYELQALPLRRRRDDIGRLLIHFLRDELARLGDAGRLDDTSRPLLPAELVARLAAYDWPGNVRQLRNVVRQLVISSRGAETLVVDRSVERLLAPAPTAPAEAPTPQLTGDQLLDALRRHAYRVGPTAEALGISRTTLYAWIDQSDQVRKARDLTASEIHGALSVEKDVGRAAMRLQVSKRGLQLRMRELQLEDG